MANPDLDQRVSRLEAKVKAIEKMLKKHSKDDESELRKLKASLEKPVNRTPNDIDKALSIVGIGEGPEDMARKFHYYLTGEK